jgi:thioesterase domain-containing protein
MNTLCSPKTADEFKQYYQLRWQILRKPWGEAKGSEQDEYEQQAIHQMVVNEQKEVLAVGRLDKLDQYQGKIRYMAVSESAQGEGLGKKIIIALEQKASELGIKEITLNARENAITFYEHLSYKNIAFSHTLFNEINHYVMVKKLPVHPKHKKEQAKPLQEIWHTTIPLSKAMGLQISYYDGNKLMTYCDVDFNKNLHHTMFAGSIYTLATLTGWGWVYLALQTQQQKTINLRGDIVLAEANIKYHAPVKGLSYGQVVKQNVSGRFDNLLKGKKARIELVAHVFCGDKIAATFTATYIVLPQN